eukprot:m.87895 g.87895  ORF g.87895 m.87895 type:complete len:202 (-) comp21428_c0_seq3:1038-1643(-)
MFAPMELPNIWSVAAQGVTFNQTYVAAPVCCPSRAAIWSSRQVHKIPHKQAGTNLPVGGSYNNFEGLPKDYDMKFNDILAKNGYNIKITGKTDFSTGGHSLTCRTAAWTNKCKFPYTLKNGSYGFYNEDGPQWSEAKDNQTHLGDWKVVHELASFIQTASKDPSTPWLAYAGLSPPSLRVKPSMGVQNRHFQDPYSGISSY